MIEKATIATLIATFLAVGFSGIEDSIDEIQNEATAVSVIMQERELKTALEIYYTKYDSYPTYADEEMVRELYETDCLEASAIPFSVEYSATKTGQDYTLDIS